MQHKAYVFDYAAFERELRPTVVRALAEDDSRELIEFIETERAALGDPYEGRVLDRDWQAKLGNRDVHEYADYALTKYYDPADDIGLSHDWQEIDDALRSLGLPETIALGSVLTGAGRAFDPGRMGSYFQSPAQIADHLARLSAADANDAQARQAVAPVRSMLEAARASGLYVTF